MGRVTLLVGLVAVLAVVAMATVDVEEAAADYYGQSVEEVAAAQAAEVEGLGLDDGEEVEAAPVDPDLIFQSAGEQETATTAATASPAPLRPILIFPISLSIMLVGC